MRMPSAPCSDVNDGVQTHRTNHQAAACAPSMAAGAPGAAPASYSEADEERPPSPGTEVIENAKRVADVQQEVMRRQIALAADGMMKVGVPPMLRNPVPPSSRGMKKAVPEARRVRERKELAESKYNARIDHARKEKEAYDAKARELFNVTGRLEQNRPTRLGHTNPMSARRQQSKISPQIHEVPSAAEPPAADEPEWMRAREVLWRRLERQTGSGKTTQST
jgi:hypothetical protein